MAQHANPPLSQSSFARVSSPAPQRSSIPVKTRRMHVMNAGTLPPVFHAYCLPGDVWALQMAMFGRLLTLRFPLMDNLILDWFAFFVPERLIWKNFERFQGFQANPGDSTDFVLPWLGGQPDSYDVVLGDVGDYLGYPLGSINSQTWRLRSGPIRAYRMIWNDHFRDQNYQPSISISGSTDPDDPIGDGPDVYADISQVLRRNKRPDYFSSSLPAPQKGPDVPIPWDNDGLAPVIGDGFSMGIDNGSATLGLSLAYPLGDGQNVVRAVPGQVDVPVGNVGAYGTATPTSTRAIGLTVDPALSHVVADIGAISATINQFRENVVLQQIYELDMRGGTRYTEALKNRWNVDAQDYRLQRPEYIQGGSSQFSVSQIAQTSPTSGEDALASLAAYSELRATGGIHYTCVEHGHLLILANIRAPLTYQQNLNRLHLASTRFDLPEPLTMNLGERAVMTSEIYFPPTNPDDVWGYQEIWAEYRYMPSFVTGQFRSVAPQSLDAWHLAIDYDNTPPVHNDEWVYDDPPVKRVVAFQDQPEFKLDLALQGKVARNMPVQSIPGLMRL